jgi:hypothetical protein
VHYLLLVSLSPSFSRYFFDASLILLLEFSFKNQTFSVLKLVTSFLCTVVLLAYDELQNYLPTLFE